MYNLIDVWSVAFNVIISTDVNFSFTFYQVLLQLKLKAVSLASNIRFLFSGKILTLQFFVSALVIFLTAYMHVLSSVSLIVPELSIKD